MPASKFQLVNTDQITISLVKVHSYHVPCIFGKAALQIVYFTEWHILSPAVPSYSIFVIHSQHTNNNVYHAYGLQLFSRRLAVTVPLHIRSGSFI